MVFVLVVILIRMKLICVFSNDKLVQYLSYTSKFTWSVFKTHVAVSALWLKHDLWEKKNQLFYNDFILWKFCSRDAGLILRKPRKNCRTNCCFSKSLLLSTGSKQRAPTSPSSHCRWLMNSFSIRPTVINACGKRQTSEDRITGKPRHLIVVRDTCAKGMRHLRDLLTAFVCVKPGGSSYNPSAPLCNSGHGMNPLLEQIPKVNNIETFSFASISTGSRGSQLSHPGHVFNSTAIKNRIFNM